MIKYVLFDFDGTLVDSKSIVFDVINQLAERHKFKRIEEKDIDYLRKLPALERCKYLKIPVYKLPFWAREFYGLYKKSAKDLNLFAGIKDLLDELNSKGYGFAIISSNAEDIIREVLTRNDIDYVSRIYCSKDIFGKAKIIKKFLTDSNLNSTQVIYVGDELRDIVACKKSNVKIIWVEWGYDEIDTLKGNCPDYTVAVPMEIIPILEKIK